MSSIRIRSGSLKGKWKIEGSSIFKSGSRYEFPFYEVKSSVECGFFEEIGEFKKSFVDGVAILRTRDGEMLEVALDLLAYETLKERINLSDPSNIGVVHKKEATAYSAISYGAVFIFAISILSDGCSSPKKKESEQTARVGNIYGQLVNYAASDVCKAAISVEFGAPVKGMRTKAEGGVYRVWYVRKFDGKRFDYRCKVMSGNSVIWATYPDGRWRDGSNGFHDTDSVLRYSENFATGKLEIYVNERLTESFSEGAF